MFNCGDKDFSQCVTYVVCSFRVLLKRHKSAENLVTVESKFQQREEAVRPEANYTKGMYCEIMIPGPGSSNAFPTVHNSPVPMRRSQCKYKKCFFNLVTLRFHIIEAFLFCSW